MARPFFFLARASMGFRPELKDYAAIAPTLRFFAPNMALDAPVCAVGRFGALGMAWQGRQHTRPQALGLPRRPAAGSRWLPHPGCGAAQTKPPLSVRVGCIG